MAPDESTSFEKARAATPESIPALLSSANENILRTLIENPFLDETHVCVLLERKDLPGALLDEIAKRKSWRTNYRVCRALAGHPHTPRLTAIRLLRHLHLMDLVQISLLPASPVEMRRLAEERVLAQLPQSPVGQRLMLARRASARIASALIAQGPEQVARVALDNAFLTESQLLKTLAKDGIPAQTAATIANHEKWSKLVNVRIALLRHPHSPLDRVLSFVPDLPRRDIEDLIKISRLRGSVRARLRHELAHRET